MPKMDPVSAKCEALAVWGPGPLSGPWKILDSRCSLVQSGTIFEALLTAGKEL